MTGEAHEGVVAFRKLSAGREAVMLGGIQIGEISPTLHPRGRFPVCFRLSLPDCSSSAWTPARDADDAKRLVLETINNWMHAAGVTPTVRGRIR